MFLAMLKDFCRMAEIFAKASACVDGFMAVVSNANKSFEEDFSRVCYCPTGSDSALG